MTNTITRDCESKSINDTCPKCGGALGAEIEILGKIRTVPVACACKQAEYIRNKEIEREKQQQKRLEGFKKYSLMGADFDSDTFENWKMDESNKRWHQIGKRYCEQWDKIKADNLGLIIYGPPGVGKTYFVSCIANELMEKKVAVIAISSIGLLNRIKETYSNHGEMGEVEVIRSLRNASLLIIDDLGAENNTEWANAKIYEIIDSRNRDGKPTIITTNLIPQKLKSKLTSSDGVPRTIDRLTEMCTTLEMTGSSRRVETALTKTDRLKKILGWGK